MWSSLSLKALGFKAKLSLLKTFTNPRFFIKINRDYEPLQHHKVISILPKMLGIVTDTKMLNQQALLFLQSDQRWV